MNLLKAILLKVASALMFALIFLILVVVLAIFAVAHQLEKYLLRWN